MPFVSAPLYAVDVNQQTREERLEKRQEQTSRHAENQYAVVCAAGGLQKTEEVVEDAAGSIGLLVDPDEAGALIVAVGMFGIGRARAVDREGEVGGLIADDEILDESLKATVSSRKPMVMALAASSIV